MGYGLLLTSVIHDSERKNTHASVIHLLVLYETSLQI